MAAREEIISSSIKHHVGGALKLNIKLSARVSRDARAEYIIRQQYL